MAKTRALTAALAAVDSPRGPSARWQASSRSLLIDPETLRAQYYAERPDVRVPEQRVAFGTSGHRGSAARRSFNEAHILAVTQAICEYRQAAGHRRAALPRHGHPRALRAGPAHRARGARRPRRRGALHDDGATPTPVISHAILTYNRGRERGARRRHRHHPLAQPARGRRHQVQPAQRRPRRHRRHRLDREARQRAARRGQRGACGASPTSAPARRPPCSRTTSSPRTWRTSATWSTWRRSAAARLRIGVDPLGGSSLAYWEPIAERYGLTIAGGEPDGRPDLPLHARGPRRQDPHGLLLALRHGRPGRAQGPLRHRLRQRHGLRPPRHRHPQRGADEPQPLPGRGHRLPLPQPPRLERGRRGRQDAGVQQHDRPRGGGPRPARRRGAGGLQVVRRRAARRLARLRRRGERGRLVPAPRRHASGPPTRTASSSTCWRPRSSRARARIRASTTGS